MPELSEYARGAGHHAPRRRWTCALCGHTGPGGHTALQAHIDTQHPPKEQ